MSDIKKRIKNARLPEKTVPVCLRGDLVAEFEDLERRLEEALRTPATSAEDDRSAVIAERMEELRSQMIEETTSFRLRAMPKPRWREFIGEHPPRQLEDGELDERDRLIGVNVDTFYDALIRQSVVNPALDEDDWLDLLGGVRKGEDGVEEEIEGVLTSRQFDELADAAWALNRREISVPFSPAASRMTRSSATE
ncbi:hypothetical protein [Micromonospora chersina]|uniref:hypothetical protein n=1 Tax=Micromonospora chersina TaxID=47854 RepID=UPI003403D162